MKNTMSSNSDGVHCADIDDDLQRALERVSEAGARLRMLEDMKKQNLCTRDILSFVEKQTDLRQVNKKLDIGTIRQAMKAKTDDCKLAYERECAQLRSIKKE